MNQCNEPQYPGYLRSADLDLGTKQARENVQGVWSFSPHKVRIEGRGDHSSFLVCVNTCKVPAECSGIRGDRRATETPSRTPSTISRKETGHGSTRAASSGRPSSAADDVGETPTPSSFTQVDAPHGHSQARVAFDFTASSPFELSVSGKYLLMNVRHVMNIWFLIHCAEGTTVRVTEEDDGSGWVKVIDNHGGKGLVPASYLEAADVKSLGPSGSSEEPRSSGQFGRHVSAVGLIE